jgi:hypothetical protein
MNKSKQKDIALNIAILNAMIYDLIMMWHKEVEHHTGEDMKPRFDENLIKYVNKAMKATSNIFEVISISDNGFRKSVDYVVCKELLLEFQKAMAELKQIDKKDLNEDGSFKTQRPTIDDAIDGRLN